MKTYHTFCKPQYLFLLLIVASLNFSCAALFDAELEGHNAIPFTAEGLLDLNEISKRIDEASNNYVRPNYFYSQQLVDLSAGFGLNSVEGNSETSFCIGAGYQYRLSEDNYNHASYIGAFGNYQSQSADDSDINILRVGADYTYFDRITKNGEVDLTYGIKGYYETGSRKFSGFKEDISGYGANLVIGANYNISDKFSVGVEVPVLSWSQRTFEYSGNEFEQQSTWLGLNKDNMVMATGRFRF